jgi:hypothetical protein
MVRPDGQACHTEYVVSETRHGCSLLRITLHTGRQHQIRLHASHNGHPLLGDWVYGNACEGLPGQALHAHRIAFQHPHQPAKQVVVESALPSVLATIWERAQEGVLPQSRELSETEKGRLKDPEDGLRHRRLPSWLSQEEAAKVRAEIEKQQKD